MYNDSWKVWKNLCTRYDIIMLNIYNNTEKLIAEANH